MNATRALFASAFAGFVAVLIPLGALAQAGDHPHHGKESKHGPDVHGESVEELRMHLDAAIKNGECDEAIVHAHEVLETSKDDLVALHAIANCTKDMASGREYSQTAVDVFEKSKILSLIPEFLDRAGIKQYLPILQDVTTQYESKENKTTADLLFLSDLYEKIGEPEKQLTALQQAMEQDPNDPRPKLLLASKKFEEGDHVAARILYREYLAAAKPSEGQAYLYAYVAALAYPLPACGALLAGIWALGAVLLRTSRRRIAQLEGDLSRDIDVGFIRRTLPFAAAVIPLLLAQRFWTSGKALPFGLLMLILLAEGALLFVPPAWRVVRPAVFKVRDIVSSLFSVRFARAMARVPAGWRVVMALGTLFVIVAIAPTIKIDDLRFAVYIGCSLVFFGTIGSLVVTFLHSSRSLSTSLRWIGVASTFPYLLIFLVLKWESIGAPLMRARLPASHAVSDLVNHLVFWGISLVLALHLSKILADALITPVKAMVAKIAVIEKGDFKARVEVFSRDEVGELADAVNRMAAGLARREFVEKTFSRYVDPKLAEKILSGEGGATEVKVKGQRMHAVVLFSDIRGFTRTSEKLAPEEVVGFLNDYFEQMVPAIRKNGGVIDKFIGDAVMAVWGVPYPLEDAPLKAVTAAIEMRDRMLKISEKFEALGYPKLGLGIGINMGEVVAGTLGAEKLEYTVIGDVVNTAQRGEANAAGQQILITEVVWNAVKEHVDADALEGRLVKGRSEPVFFWSVRGLKAAAAAPAKAAQG